jgi:hypothetical protein
MENFYTKVIQKSRLYHSEHLVSSLELLEPNFRQKIERLIIAAAAQGHKLMVYETFRSQARQEQLYKEKKTELRTKGVHHYGLAADIVFDVHGEPRWPSAEHFSILEPLARAQDLIWGGNWGRPPRPHSFVDPDHLQWCSVEQEHALLHDQWYPVAGYNPYQDGAV